MLNKVVEFLIVPESNLSVIFLIAFILVFIFGILSIHQCDRALSKFKKEGANEFASMRAHVNQKQFITQFNASQSAREIRVNDLPNMLIMIGILGTFLGLGVAIHGAANLLNAEHVDLARLNDVLGVIAFKFQTSVWGTFFSLLFLKFFAEPYFIRKASCIASVETEIYADALSDAEAVRQQLDALEKVSTGQKAVQTAVADSIKSQSKLSETMLSSNTKHQGEVLRVMDEKLTKLTDAQDTLFDTVTEGLTAQTNSILDHIQTSLQETLEAQDGLTQALTSMKQEIEQTTRDNSQSILDDVLEHVQLQGLRMDELIEEQNRLSSSLFAAAKTDQFALSQSLVDAVKKEVNDLAQKQTAETLDVMDEVEKSANATRESILNEVKGQFNEVVIGGIKTVAQEGMKVVLGSVQQNISESQERARALLDKNAAESRELATSLLTSIDARLHQAYEMIDEMMTKQTTLSRNIVNEQKALFGSVSEAAKKENKALIFTMAEHLKTQQDNLNALVERHNHLNEILLGDLSKMGADQVKSIQLGFVQQMEEYKRFSETLAQKQEKTQTDLSNRLADIGESIEASSRTSNSNVAEIRDAIGVLQKAIDENSRALEDIIGQFYEKQNEMDALRRTEIMGIAQSFSTLLKQEGSRTADWRKRESESKENRQG